MTSEPEETLDPEDWSAVRAVAHKMVDDAIDHLRQVRSRPVWRPMPRQAETPFDGSVPMEPQSLRQVYEVFQATIAPYPMGNIHPRFWGWYMGAGNFTGALADFLAAIDGSNLGGGDTGAARAESQVLNWLKEMMGFPTTASGALTSGGSVANLVCLTVARNARAGVDVRADGVATLPQELRFYASDQAHSCHQKALEILGLGARALRLIPTDAAFRMDLAALERQIARDRDDGKKPVCVIATAGAVSTGAIDDLSAIRSICAREDMWFHVDGCIGALLKIAPNARGLVDGLEAANSVALDPHKWLHTPFEAGCALVRDAEKHRSTFEMHGAYLQLQTRGVLSGDFLADYGLQLSRSFKALKIWMSLKEHGVSKFGRLVDQNVAQAARLAQLIEATPELELMAPVPINIVCFRYRGPGGDEAALRDLNLELMLRIQESGGAVLSDTTLDGRHSLRVAIANHRTEWRDLEFLIEEVKRIGRALAPNFL